MFHFIQSNYLFGITVTDFYQDEKYLEEIDTNWNKLLPFILDYNYTVSEKNQNYVSQQIRQHYLKEKPVNRKNFLDFVKIISDRTFIVDIHKTAKLQASLMESPVYFYYFTYRGAHSKSEYRSGTDKNFGKKNLLLKK